MIIKTDIPAAEVWKLTNIAEDRGLRSVAELLSALASEALEKKPRHLPTLIGVTPPKYDRYEIQAQIRDLHSHRFNDAAMADLVGCSEETIRRHRNQLGLQPNRQTRKNRS